MFVNDPRLVAEVFRKSKELDKDWRLMAPFSQARRPLPEALVVLGVAPYADKQASAPASAPEPWGGLSKELLVRQSAQTGNLTRLER